MSLKSFHILFITVTVLFSLFCAYWSFSTQTWPSFGYASVGAAVALVIYGFWFLRKARNIIV